MALRILNKNISDTMKRADFTAKKSGIWSDTFVYSVRVLTRSPLKEKSDFVEALRTALDNKEDWQTSKNGTRYYRIADIDATVYITSEKNLDEEE